MGAVSAAVRSSSGECRFMGMGNLRKYRFDSIAAVLASCSALLAGASVAAATISAPPNGNNFQDLAANVPGFGNVWNGVGQSFTDQDPKIEAGLYIVNYSGHDVTNSQFQYSLYQGDGVVGSPIITAVVSVSIPNFGAPLLTLETFSGVTLTPGQQYTLVASLVGEVYPPSDFYSDLGVAYNSTSSDSFGSFYFTGSSYDNNFKYRTIAFEVKGAGVPEPSTWAMLLLGFSGLGFAGYRKTKGATRFAA